MSREFDLRDVLGIKLFPPGGQYDIEKVWNYFEQTAPFLTDPQRFPNNEVNKLIQFLLKAINLRLLPIVYTSDDPKLAVNPYIAGADPNPFLALNLPNSFPDQIYNNPVDAMCDIIKAASVTRDISIGPDSISEKGKVEDAYARGSAFQAEFLTTLKRLADQKGVQVKFSEPQESILTQFPQGLKSLDPRLRYTTPLPNIPHLS